VNDGDAKRRSSLRRVKRGARAGGSGTPCLQRGFASYSWSGFGASRLQHFTVGSNDVRDGDDWAQMSGENIARGRPRIIFMFQEDAAC